MEHLHNGILLSHKIEEYFTLLDYVDGPRENYAKLNKLVKERQMPNDFTHIWNVMDKLN